LSLLVAGAVLFGVLVLAQAAGDKKPNIQAQAKEPAKAETKTVDTRIGKLSLRTTIRPRQPRRSSMMKSTSSAPAKPTCGPIPPWVSPRSRPVSFGIWERPTRG